MIESILGVMALCAGAWVLDRAITFAMDHI